MTTNRESMEKSRQHDVPVAAPLVFLLPVVKDRPDTGGELVNTRLAAGLSREWALTVVDWNALGVTRETPPAAYAAAGEAAFARFRSPGIVLHDTLDYWRSAGLAARLRARGWIVATLGQAIYPDRYRGAWSRWRARRRLARYLRACGGPHVVVSHGLRDSYLPLGVAAADVVVVPPGFDCVDHPYLPTRSPRRAGALRVVTAGSYMPAKGQHIVVEAVRRLLARDPSARGAVRLDAYGGRRHAPAYVEALDGSVAAGGFGDAIAIHDVIPQPALWERFLAADVFCFPAVGEGLGMVLIESMLAGCVPVVSPSPPLLELVRHGVTGVVAARDPAAVAVALEDLRSGRHDLAALAAAARQRALEFARAWPIAVGELSMALRRALGRAGRPS